MRAYIKDCLDINGNTKAFLNLKSGSVREDRMTTANSTFECHAIDSNVNIGDIFILLDKGKTLYYGVVSAIKDKQITTTQIYNVFNGSFIYSIVDELKTLSPSTYLEDEIKKVLQHYSQGRLYNSTYVDTLIATKLSSINLTSINSLETLLESDIDDKGQEKFTQKDMVKWLYELYDSYGIVFDFTIPIQNGTSEVKIWKPNYSGIKITDGFECISSIVPTTEQQKQNKLVVYWNSEVVGQHQAKEYRNTYVLTSNGIVEAPSSIVGRMNQVNTKIVFSDDDIEDVISANLNETLFNHKIEFNVDLQNKLFNFDDLKLDLPIEVFSGTEYYNTLITKKEFSFSDDIILNLKITGGKIRNSLTDKMLLGLIK